MMTLFKKIRPPVGARPGTLTVAPGSPPPELHLIRYTPTEVQRLASPKVAELATLLRGEGVAWLDVQGLGDADLLQQLAEVLELHPLLIEDVAHTPQRPKCDDYTQHLLVVTRQFRLLEGTKLDVEQISLVVGPGWVITFQERPGDVFDPIRARIDTGKGLIRTSGADYLAYALLDTVVDAYYPIVEVLGDHLEALEARVMDRPSKRLLVHLNEVKHTLLQLRRGLWPQRDSLSTMARGDFPVISDTVRTYLRDTHDHCVQVADVVESYRELVNGLLNTYLTVVSNRMNEVMKVLTIMASIFIPLTFMAGIYGMNFEHMPELHVQWAYPVLWIAMALVVVTMLVFFRRKGWLGGDEHDDTPDD